MSDQSVNIDPNTQEIDPLVVIDSLRGQVAAASIEIAKRDALLNKLGRQLLQQGQIIRTLNDASEQQNVAKTNGEVNGDDQDQEPAAVGSSTFGTEGESQGSAQDQGG